MVEDIFDGGATLLGWEANMRYLYLVDRGIKLSSFIRTRDTALTFAGFWKGSYEYCRKCMIVPNRFPFESICVTYVVLIATKCRADRRGRQA